MTPDTLPAADFQGLPPLYRSEGFAEDLPDLGDAAAAPTPSPLRALEQSAKAMLLGAIPVVVALLGAGVVSGS